ncbi:glycerol-3-phosphate 1-O-acyltransferase PlsY [SAR202 cluster bacterium AC-409-J13_OGT_754m]|nr:glycerol-3-phosphate 1-O-acyltransferase PlsY [SAR202 cluster bacterium AC-409-J13_OGT_754m]
MRYAVLLLGLPPIIGLYIGATFLWLDTDKTYAQYMIIAPLVYIMGSVPWGYMVFRLHQGADIRTYGSGKIGTSNILRTAGLRIAVVVLALDVSKGVLAVFLARAISDSPVTELVAALLTMIGHNWSLFLGFKGGRGLAPAAGSMVIFSPLSIVIGVGFFLAVTLGTKFLSLGSLVGVLVVFVVLTIQVSTNNTEMAYLVFICVGGLMIFWQHRDNIQRLIKGTERRITTPSKKIPGEKADN